MDSLEALRLWAMDAAAKQRSTLFYLDAHGREHLPLGDELDLIHDNYRRWIIVVDDFKVPGDSGYAFDDCGPGRVLDIDYLRSTKVRDAPIFFRAFPPNGSRAANEVA